MSDDWKWYYEQSLCDEGYLQYRHYSVLENARLSLAAARKNLIDAEATGNLKLMREAWARIDKSEVRLIELNEYGEN